MKQEFYFNVFENRLGMGYQGIRNIIEHRLKNYNLPENIEAKIEAPSDLNFIPGINYARVKVTSRRDDVSQIINGLLPNLPEYFEIRRAP